MKHEVIFISFFIAKPYPLHSFHSFCNTHPPYISLLPTPVHLPLRFPLSYTPPPGPFFPCLISPSFRSNPSTPLFTPLHSPLYPSLLILTPLPALSPSPTILPHTCISYLQGDIGSPLVCRDHLDSRWHLVGLVSWGSPDCRQSPLVFSRIGSFITWIHSIMLSN